MKNTPKSLSLFIKTIIIIIVIIVIPINIWAINIEDEEELDYIWLDNKIKEAKDEDEIKTNSKYIVAFDRTSKTVIWGKNENIKTPMASTTKIMTAIILLEKITNLDEKQVVTYEAGTIGGSRIGLKVADKISYNDLLYGLMLKSGNDAAVQIAISVAGSVDSFCEMMNDKANEMGLKSTHFTSPHGLDNKNHYTTATELAIITDYALNIDKFMQVVSTKNYTIDINGYRKNINNTNELLGYLDGVNGVKTGFTNKAGRCLVTSVDRDGFNIITVVLGADTKKTRTYDSIKVIEYIYKNYELVDLTKIIEENFNNWMQINEKRIKIYKGKVKIAKIMLEKTKILKYPVLKSKKSNIYVDINSIFMLEAPIEENKKIGEAKIIIDTTEIERLDIIIFEKIERKTVIFYLDELLTKLHHTFCYYT